MTTSFPSTISELAREIPVEASADVVIAGGGPAGLAAALGAARAGAKTILVERNGFLGGVATASLMTIFLDYRRHLHGVVAEFVDELVARGLAFAGRVINFDPEGFKEVALEKVVKSGITLRLYSWAVQPVVQDGTVKGIVVESKSGRGALLANVTVDCTGDADLAFRAGVPCVEGREKDGKMRPVSLVFRMGNIDFYRMAEFARQNPEQFQMDPNYQVLDMDRGVLRFSGFFDLAAEGRQRGELDPDCHYLRFEGVDLKRGISFVNSVRVYGVDGTDAASLTGAELQAREQMRKLVAFIHKYVPGCEQAWVIDTAPSLGVRETRRIRGEYVLTEEDIAAGKVYPDSVGSYWKHSGLLGVEIHSPDAGEMSDADPQRSKIHTGVCFQIPYGCYVPQGIDGLLVAGRSISQTHQADKFTRQMPCCMVMGQGAGVGAAVAARDKVPPRRVNVSEVQRLLTEQGVVIDAKPVTGEVLEFS